MGLGGSTTATGPIETVIDEDLLQDFNVKYVGALRCARAVIPFMKMEGWGRIINISVPTPATPAISAAEHAIPPWCT
jgi:NAD(P)-dependent dehydrogenase (short-subunit alcohol dehydrogenase family)